VRVPVIASGGVGSLSHFVEGAAAGATGLLAASVFHDGVHRIDAAKDVLSAAGWPVRRVRELA
jgi:cyclase